MDTIFALSTAPGAAAIAVIRVSGPGTDAALTGLGIALPAPRVASVRTLRDASGAPLDQALVLRFEAGASFTGEASAELHCHGSPAVLRAVMAALEGAGARLAEPGEFTRRALMNDRLDLTEVQGLADVIAAETETQRAAAMAVMSGAYAARIAAWRRDLIHAMALLEATIDFADEEVPEDVMPEVRALLGGLRDELRAELGGAAAARSLRSGFRVAILGEPNVGKSSFLNYIARSDVAIVTPIAGTTRDALDHRVDLGGLLVIFSDTAGLRVTDDAVEAIGIARARERAEAADLRLFLHDGRGIDALPVAPRDGDLVIRTKADLDGGEGISTVDGRGIEALLATIGERLGARASEAGHVSRQRDEAALRDAAASIEGVLAAGLDAAPELAIEELRRAAHQLAVVTGEVGVEAVLDDVFFSFCLGK
jgi:tRNA modification GTPase